MLNLAVAVAILAGLVGVVVPVLPGLLLVWGAVVVWALVDGTPTGAAVAAVATGLLAVGTVVKYLVPGRRLRRAGVPTTSLIAGTVLGIVGFFVVPIVGLPLGFVGGIYLAELLRLGARGAAGESTGQAMRAVGLSIVIELAAGLLIAVTWVVAVIAG